ncbi:hypothetical protein CORT_0B08850 [Candida orthopsilosis Co 90-125]|uniref:Uncharacterized protein n=1 Tax=Candida orthopsilosis (strain 90-125) TaxID=1136231 RepID=H8X077_CANO9|nr:hypothetical protein CORT_0B08850 [Candida orthopsilosis Co 90-125]CCG22589.1 hypothetical protein CORT_0B08850 [Candida orthopsilosis Co 90-125]
MTGANSLLDEKRPATALHRVLEKVVSMSGFGAPASTQSHNDNTVTGEHSAKLSRSSSYKINQKLGKLIKLNIKTKKLEKGFLNDTNLWADFIPTQDCSSIIKDFNFIFSAQTSSSAQLNEKLEKIKLSLSFVSEREKKQKELLYSKIKLEKQLKENKARVGPKASSTVLIIEKLEEVDCSLQVVEQQFVRSISNDLKESIIDYIYTLHSTSRKLNEVCEDFIECVNSLEQSHSINGLEQSNFANGFSHCLRDGELGRTSPTRLSKLALRRKSPQFPQHYSDNDQIKLKNYDLPTPQSSCAECKKVPCMHTDQDNGTQPLKSNQASQPPSLPSQEQNLNIRRTFSKIYPLQSQANSHFGEEFRHDQLRDNSILDDHWS